MFEQGKDISDSLEGKLTKELKDQGIEVIASLREHGIRLAADENPNSFFKKAIDSLMKKSGGLLTKAVLVGAILLTLSATSCSVQNLKDCSSKEEAVEQQESVLQSVVNGYGNGFCYEIYEVVGN